ncbi:MULTISPECIES: hypothetical protein [Pseudomonas]|jgi:hypothetical protein|uniref:Uncharacterized protein n=1 Tax=Pseudomonas putida TaxID=303 RepID=A0A379KJ87_PSEPU|nr:MULTISPECIES: hypothetical protein [Pseudomonas]QPN44730.1 hypothetical protein I5S86_24850 [Priestia aryabhattai]MBM7397776.1 hypothetical protein [Pseudomonas sp. M5]RRV48155.1 hypothetical protein EGJ09_05245 [Pseudomonas sp. p106]SUD68065.1 Uncharacterised protein [Pseudomonas putida]HDS1757885.1 hypothetical protein [Pseudomonas putida]
MASLWTLLFQRPRHNTYARLDGDGNCLGFKQCSQPPGSNGWVQVKEIQLAWLGRPLPANARVCAHASGHWQRRTLPA